MCPANGQWSTLEPETRHARLREPITATWNGNEALHRRRAQNRNQSIKAYLVDNTALPAQGRSGWMQGSRPSQ